MYYYLLSHQPMKPPVFKFRKGRNKKKFNAGTPDGKPTSDGTVCVTLTINNIKYGPMATDIYCFRKDWEGRRAARPGEESVKLSRLIAEYSALLIRTHAQLVHTNELNGENILIDGDMVMGAVCADRARLKIETIAKLQAQGIVPIKSFVTLSDVYIKFMAARLKDIEPNRHKRTEEQISESTYNTYPKRWEMIKAYLDTLKRKDIAVMAIKPVFGEEIKDFLKGIDQLTAKEPRKGAKKEKYAIASINKALSLLKQLMKFAVKRGYIRVNPITELSCRGGSGANPKPLTQAQMDMLETVYLPSRLRLICDSWLVAAELCLHHSDYMKLPYMKILVDGKGKRYIQHDRNKQTGDSLLQTVNITERAERIIEKYGIKKLYYKSSGEFSDALKMIALRANLVDAEGEIIPLQFGQGRDTGLTSRVIEGANGLQLTKMGGWASPRVANKYIGLDLEIVQGFAGREVEVVPEGI